MSHSEHEGRARLGQRIQNVSRLWRRVANQRLDDYGVSHATAAPLLALWRMGGEARQGVVAEMAGLEGPSMVRLVDVLLAEGLITRREDPSDRRAKILQLTTQGEARMERIMTVLDDLREELLAGIDEDALAGASAVLERLEATLEDI